MDKKLNDAATESYRDFFREGALSLASAAEGFRAEFLDVHPGYHGLTFPPPIFETAFIDNVADVAGRLLDLVYSIPKRLFGGRLDTMLEQQGVRGAEAQYLAQFFQENALSRARLFARPDFLLTRTGFKAVELNISPPVGGLGICDRYVAIFGRSRLAQALAERRIQWGAPAMGQLWALAFQQNCKALKCSERARFFEAISDPKADPSADFARPDFAAMATAAGFELISGHFDDLELERDRVSYRGEKIDVVFTDFVYAEQKQVVGQSERMQQLAALDHAGHVELFAAPAYTLYDNKANFAFLTDDQYSSLFTREERQLIAQYVPKTYRVTHDTLAFAIQNQQTLVLKPSLDFGGHGVLLGLRCSAESWADALHAAVDSTSGFILQDLISDLWTYTYPGDDVDQKRMVCLGSIHLGGRHAGTLLREDLFSGRPSVVNVAQGARWGTVLVADGR